MMPFTIYADSAPDKYTPNSFESPLFSGYLDYDYKIDVPPGIYGTKPELSVSYNSHSARKKAGWVGAGWEVPLIYIQRDIQNTPTDTTDDAFDLILGGMRSDLAYLSAETRYHTKVESYLKIEKKTGAPNETGEYWTVTTPDGTEFRFGYNLDSENMVNSSDPLVPHYVWRWSLDRLKDPNGNCIYFTYSENPTANDKGAVYLSKIEYNNDRKRLIEFILENTDRPDMSTTVEQGSEIQEARRLSEIRISVDGILVKKFKLEYVLNTAQNKSLLERITKYGTDGITSLNPTKFEYTTLTDPSTGEQADLLAKITNELGGTTTIGYSLSSTFPNTALPYNYWLATSLTVDNGMAGAHANTITTNLSYENGLYDSASDEFRGFGKVTETRADNSKTVHTFYQDDAKKGKEAGTEIVDGQNNPYISVGNLWSDSFTDGVYTVRLDSTEQKTFDGSPDNPKITKAEYLNYDTYGNIGLVTDHGDLSINGDETYSYREFVYNTDRYIVNKVKHSYISSAQCPSSSTCATKLRESWFYYDGWFILDGAPFKGNLTKSEQWNNQGSKPVTSYQYDSYGNLIKTVDPEGRVTQINYDPDYHTFPIEVINAKSQLTRRTYNSAGQVTSETDPNGNTTSYVYDVFNRLTKIVRHYDSDAFPTALMQYSINSAPPHRIMMSARETAGGGTLDSVQIIDGLGRAIQTRSEYENPANSIVADVYFDSMGRDYKLSNTYLSGYSTDYTSPDTNVPASRTDYDPLGRPKKMTNPDGTFETRSYDHWIVTETDENGHSKSYVSDADNKMIEVVERNNGETYTTNYQYSLTGELLKLTDHFGNISTNEYDSLGRRIKMFDVDLGQRTFTYDLSGNMLSQTDAKGITTKFQYDPLDRQTMIDYPNDKDVYFVYDLNTKGVLSQVTDSAGMVTFKYDQRLRRTEETKAMDGYSWTTKWEYDSMDRVIKQTYPDGGIVTYNYTPQGRLGSIPGFVNALSYNAQGQLVRKDYANGKSTTFTYNNINQLLTKIMTSGIQDFTYSYDNTGNVISIANAVAGVTETFQYDDLNRLIHAYDNAATNGYDKNYVYDAIGNMKSEANNKTGDVTQYTYGQGTAKPHAVTGKTDRMPLVGSFVLDNGNPYCTRQQVDLSNISMGYPPEYMASESADFSGAIWKPYSINPAFVLSTGYGTKKVYFKVRNANGESPVKSDDIEFLQDTDGDGTPNIYDADDDNDGIPDIADVNPLDPTNAILDPDGDGLNNLQEYLNNTNPNLSDSDNDGWTDYDEVVNHGTNPNSRDTDGDGLEDTVDPNPRNPYNDGFSENYSVKQWVFNTGGHVYRVSENYDVNDRLGSGFSRGAYADADGDGMPDSWEVDNGLNPSDHTDALNDTDADGLTNYQEYVNHTNPNLTDTDNDGWSDYQEIYIYHTSPDDADTDNDGVKDSLDPNSKSIYHYGVSENFSVRAGNFNEGGNTRSSENFIVSDRIAADLGAAAESMPGLTVSPEDVNFDSALVGTPSAATLLIKNNGLDNVVIGALSLTGADTVEFSLGNDNCSNRILSPFISCTVEIVLLPKSNGAKASIVNIPYNDSETKYLTVLVSGIVQPDSMPPDTIITTKPDNASSTSWATFDFTSTESISTYECRKDGESFESCFKPVGYVYLNDGEHTFEVRATDGAGNTDPTPASYTWTVDTVRPSSAVTLPVNGTTIIGTAFTVKGTASDTGSGVQNVEVSTDGGATWNSASGTTVWSYTWAIPANGMYTIKSRATDNAGNLEMAGQGITVTAYNRQPSAVSIDGRRLLMNGDPFIVKGVGYSPTPIGDDPETMPPYGDYFTSGYSSIYERDLPLLRAMGANTVRLWGWDNYADYLDFLDKAYNNGVNPIYVITGFWINPGLDIDPASTSNVREYLKVQFREMVALHKNHPAILIWSIGNELNAPWMYGGTLNNLFSLINEMASEAHDEDPNHPVVIPLADIDLINMLSTYGPSVPSLNIWGANIYRGGSFGTLFTDYSSVSTKPLLVLEYGIDAYDNIHQMEYETAQAQYAENLWDEIQANSNICIGGSVMAYSDEWWKGKYSTDAGCPESDPSVHGICGYVTASHQDGYCNEEWWGIMRAVDNVANPDIMEPREVYYTLQGLWVDSDNDGISNSHDNCPDTSNPNQADTDTDNYGNACDCDLDNNNFVGPSDFNIFKAAWLSDPSKVSWNANADFDSDNFIGPKDFNIFKTRWLKSGPWQ